MLYQMYQAQTDMMTPVRLFADASRQLLAQPWAGTATNGWLRTIDATCEAIVTGRTTHGRPPFEITTTRVGNETVGVTEEAVDRTPFGTLLRFRKDTKAVHPRVLVVAPMSGHFATLLRGTVEAMLPEHDVHITDWHNGRDVPIEAGRFGFEDFVDHIIRFLEALGPGAHVVAVCQPAVAVLAAVAIMAAAGNKAQPRSMTLMAGPIDTRRNPTKVNDLAKQNTMDWFERKMIARVPARYKGAGRRVYPGFVQLGAFMAMNLDRHVRAHLDHFDNLVKGRTATAEMHRKFYDEYLAVMDLPAEFYLETVQRVFQDHDLPLGRLMYRGRPVDPGAIRRTMLFTVEGEQDDICAIGQTSAALDLCTNLRPAMKRHHLQTGAGHYGVFNGRRWRQEIYPMVREVIQYSEAVRKAVAHPVRAVPTVA